jgi:alpha-L-fucosidase
VVPRSGFGLFIYWSVDSQLGVVVSHSLAGASPEYTDRFFTDLPKSFDPHDFHPLDWARLAHLAGVRYVMMTTKHHSGFTMFDTATTPFGIMSTPFHRDITREVFDAFRSQGIATGVYYSPDDFWWLHQHGKTIERSVPEVQPRNKPRPDAIRPDSAPRTVDALRQNRRALSRRRGNRSSRSCLGS